MVLPKIILIATVITVVLCKNVSSFLEGKMDCGQFFCPMEIPAEYDDTYGTLVDDNKAKAVVGTSESSGINITTITGDNTEPYCCFTLPKAKNPITTPYCCTYGDYSDNLYAHTGLTPVSRLVIAFFPVGIAVLICLIIAFYIVYFICCKMQRTGHSPERRMTAV